MEVNKGYEFRGSAEEPKMGKPKKQGLDLTFEKESPAKGEARHVVIEAKYNEARLTGGQETLKWVDERLDTAVGPQHANRMRLEGYEYWTSKYNPKLKRVIHKRLWKFVHNDKFGPEQFPGAGRKPLGQIVSFPPEDL
jgi:hypothetical protein